MKIGKNGLSNSVGEPLFVSSSTIGTESKGSPDLVIIQSEAIPNLGVFFDSVSLIPEAVYPIRFVLNWSRITVAGLANDFLYRLSSSLSRDVPQSNLGKQHTRLSPQEVLIHR